MKIKLASVAIGLVFLLGFSGNAIAEEFGYVRYEMEDCGTVCYDFGEWGYCQDSCGEEAEICPGPTATRIPYTEPTPSSEPTYTDAPEATATDVPPVETPTSKANCGQNKDHDCGHGNDGDQSDNDNPHGGPFRGKGGSGRDEEQGGTKGGRHDR